MIHSKHCCPVRSQTCIRRSVRAAASRSIQLSHREKPIMFPHLGSGMLFARSTGLRIWPAAVVIAEFLINEGFLQYRSAVGTGIEQLHDWKACTVVELGCGLGLGSIVSAQLGARVSVPHGNGVMRSRLWISAGAFIMLPSAPKLCNRESNPASHLGSSSYCQCKPESNLKNFQSTLHAFKFPVHVVLPMQALKLGNRVWDLPHNILKSLCEHSKLYGYVYGRPVHGYVYGRPVQHHRLVLP